MILFLDFDGVLHPDPCFDRSQQFCCLPRLENVLCDFPHVNVVVSSSWRETRTIDQLRSFFPPSLTYRIIGVTPIWRDHQDLADTIRYHREREIETWMRMSTEPWLPWVALDDKPHLFRPFLPNVIKTNPALGFDINAEIALRNKFHGN